MHDNAISVIKCQYCGKNITEISKLYAHGCQVPSGRHERCQLCNKSFPNQDELKIHYLREHNNQLTCQICYKQFQTKAQLETHIQATHKEPGYIKAEK